MPLRSAASLTYSDQDSDPGAVMDRVSMLLNPAQFARLPSPLTKPLLFFFLAILFIFPGATSHVSPANLDDDYYPKFCSHMFPLSPSLELAAMDSIQSLTGYFSASSAKSSISGMSFQPTKAFTTGIKGLIKLRGSLVLMDPNALIPKNPGNSTKGRRLRKRTFHVRGPSIPLQRRDRARFKLYGYWSQSSGNLCMIGSAWFHTNGGKLRFYDALLKLSYPVKSSINASLITGVLESLDGSDSSNDQFESFSLLGFIKSVDYDYTLIEKERGKESFSEFGGEENLSLERINQDVCTAFRWNSALELEYDSVCSNTSNSCNPLGRDVQFSPNVILLTRIKCSNEGKMRLLMKFRNTTKFFYNADYYGFDPSITFIGEGEWDKKENRLCAVVCRFLNFSQSLSDTFVGDCSIRLCLRFPSSLSIKSRSPLVGQLWTTKPVDDSGYFMKLGLQGSGKPLTGMKYEYTVVSSRPPCVKPKSAKRKGRTYPDPASSDMSFDMSVKDSKGHVARGYSSPFFVADQPYDSRLFGFHYFAVANQTTTTTAAAGSSSVPLQNISYTMSFTIPSTFKVGSNSIDFLPNKTVEILAEGSYDRDYGSLCMVGCRRLSKNSSSSSSSSFDCEIQVDIEFPPLKAKASEKTKGSIRSTRSKSDPLYFEPLQLSSNSAYLGQVEESIWRMDLEIVMVLISNSLTCIFLGLQLYHVKKHPDTISLVSMMMLLVLTLGLMMPLLLNFEALFDGKANRPNYILGASGGWLEVNEVVVRVVTMVAFLLQLRLVQLNWSGRTQTGWGSEKKVVYTLLPVYIIGGLIAWFVFLWKKSTTTSSRLVIEKPQLSLWEHSKSYAGLVLDGFLLPQILFNLFSDSTEKALASSFYMGITMVRLLPHGYDLCRAQISAWYPDISYIYANHRMDFYSTGWDIIIPCFGMLFAVIVLLQQRFGGRVLLPRRFRRAGSSNASDYDKVPSIEM